MYRQLHASLLLWTALAIFTAAPGYADGLTLIPIPSDMLEPTHLTYEWADGDLIVSGRIEKSHDRYGRILGHVELDLLDNEGKVLAIHSGALTRFSPRRPDPDWASFRTRVEQVPAGVAAIRVRHVIGAWH